MFIMTEKFKNLIEKPKKFALTTTSFVASFFFKDFRWKVLALALAFMLWLVGVNVTNPIQTRSYDNLTLNVLGMDQLALNNAVLLNEPMVGNTRINASVMATSSNHQLIESDRSNNIQASINLSTINFEQVLELDQPVSLYVDVNLFINQDHVTSTMQPSRVRLDLDRFGVVTKRIVPDIAGTAMEGFEQRDPILSQRLVRLSGARSLLDDVNDVRVRVYIDDAYETVEEVGQLVVYNSQRENLTGLLNLGTQEVHIQVPILPYASIPLRVTTTGSPLPGFMATDINISPTTLSLVGTAEEIAETSTLILGEVDLTMARQTTEHTFDIREALSGTGLTLRDEDQNHATVTVVVEQVIERNMFLPLEYLTVTGYTRPYFFGTEEPIMLSLRGRESVINALTLNQINASLDLTGLGAGTHQLPIEVAPPSGAVLANLATVEITLEPEPLVFQPEDPPDWTADLENEGYENGENGDEDLYEDEGLYEDEDLYEEVEYAVW